MSVPQDADSWLDRYQRSDAASVFLRVLANREQKDAGSVKAIFSELRGAVDFVASSQEYFDAPPEIYGHFTELGAEIHRLCHAGDARDARA